MPFDFSLKHEGEPPARILAKVQMRLRDAKLPVSMAKALAPLVDDESDLDDGLIADLSSVVRLLERANVEPARGLELFEQAVANRISQTESEEGDGEDEDEITAWRPSAPKQAQTLTAAVRALKGSGPKMRNHAPSDRPMIGSRGRLVEALADGLQARMDRRHTPTIGREFAGLSLGEIAMHCVRASGNRPMNMQEAIRMATHTTSDFPQVLENALGKSIARQMEQITPAIARAAHELPAIDYRGGSLLSLSASSMPQEIGEGGEIKYVTIDESGERKPAPRDFGAMFGLSNKAIYNDDLGLFDQISKKMVAGATERFRAVLLEPLIANSGLGHDMADGKSVFHADHGNVAAAGSVLSIESLSAARLALRSQRGKQGEYYAIEPWALVVPPQLETLAQQVLAEINATKTADVNPFSGALELIVEVGLPSSKAWYLIGNPANSDGLAYSFLDGRAAPSVESKPGWDTLGTEFRLVWALDARFVSSASWYKNAGQ